MSSFLLAVNPCSGMHTCIIPILIRSTVGFVLRRLSSSCASKRIAPTLLSAVGNVGAVCDVIRMDLLSGRLYVSRELVALLHYRVAETGSTRNF